jgi:hypothetical protein
MMSPFRARFVCVTKNAEENWGDLNAFEDRGHHGDGLGIVFVLNCVPGVLRKRFNVNTIELMPVSQAFAALAVHRSPPAA